MRIYLKRFEMPRLDLETRRRVITLFQRGTSVTDIQNRLAEENSAITRQSLHRLIRKFRDHGTVQDLPKRTRSIKLTDEMMEFIDSKLQENDELTAEQLRSSWKEMFPDVNISLSSIKRGRKKKGWVSTRPHYCQLIRELNKRKRLLWCEFLQRSNEKFENIIFTDECTVQLDRHSRICFRKKRQGRKLKPRPKHPIKLHIWGGISSRGATNILLFSGIMDAPRFQQILEAGLKPFINECFPDSHRLQMDNDPKHCSKLIEDYLSSNEIVWWRTPAESPDMNPIENVWGSLKQYLRSTYKPQNLEDLKEGIQRFWSSLTPDVCQRYINHLTKVIPKVIEVRGEPSGY